MLWRPNHFQQSSKHILTWWTVSNCWYSVLQLTFSSRCILYELHCTFWTVLKTIHSTSDQGSMNNRCQLISWQQSLTAPWNPKICPASAGFARPILPCTELFGQLSSSNDARNLRISKIYFHAFLTKFSKHFNKLTFTSMFKQCVGLKHFIQFVTTLFKTRGKYNKRKIFAATCNSQLKDVPISTQRKVWCRGTHR